MDWLLVVGAWLLIIGFFGLALQGNVQVTSDPIVMKVTKPLKPHASQHGIINPPSPTVAS